MSKTSQVVGWDDVLKRELEEEIVRRREQVGFDVFGASKEEKAGAG